METRTKRQVVVDACGIERITGQSVVVPIRPRIKHLSNAERRALKRQKHLAKKRIRKHQERLAFKTMMAAGDAGSRPLGYRATRDAFLCSDEWRRLRYDTLRRNGARCQACNTDRTSGKVMHVDHIKPMWTHWHLRADPLNLQVLCEDCNVGKGAWDDTDWR